MIHLLDLNIQMQGLHFFRFPWSAVGNLRGCSKINRRLHHLTVLAMSTAVPTPAGPASTPENTQDYGPQRITRGRRDVVTAFVVRRQDASVLLVKRSEKVNTYKLHWGGVSGVVEGDENLVNRARQEASFLLGKHPFFTISFDLSAATSATHFQLFFDIF